MFGEIDLLPFKQEQGKLVECLESFNPIRQFSVQAKSDAKVLSLKVEDLERIQINYPDYYNEIFEKALFRLETTLKLR